MSNEVEIVVTSVDKTSTGFNSADRSASSLGDKLKGIAKVGMAGLAGGIVAVGAGLFSAAKAAAEDEASQAKLAQTLRNSAGATDAQIAKTEDWISAQGRALGVADDDLRPALQRLTEATGDVGEAQKLASLAMDVSAGTGKSLKSVSEALMKAQNGQVAGLSRLGIETKNANDETISFDQAVKKMSDTFGGQAAAQANTLQGRMGRLKLMFDETKESIGAKLLPVLTSFATWFMDKGIPAVQAFVRDLQRDLRPTFETVKEVVKDVIAYVKENWPEIRKQIISNLQVVKEFIVAFVGLVRDIWNKWGDDIMRRAKLIFDLIKDTIKNSLQVIRGIIQVVTGLIKGDWGMVWEGIKNIFGGVWNQIKNLLRFALGNIKEQMRETWDAIKDITKNAWSAVADMTRTAVGRVFDIISFLPEKILKLEFKMAKAGVQLIKNFLDGILDPLKNIGSWVKDHVYEPIKDAVWDAFKFGSPSKVAEGWGKNVMAGFFKGLGPKNWLNMAKQIFGGMQGAISHVIGSLGSGIDSALFGDALSYQQIGRRLLAGMGWSQYWSQFNALVMGESGWNPLAQNPTSSAFGIGQFLDSTWATVGYTKTTDAGMQIAAMLKYIMMNYGNPANAYAAWLSRSPHWYGSGLEGRFDSPTLIGVGESGPEDVSVVPVGRGRRGQRIVLEIRSGGSRFDDALLEVLRKSIRVKGGDVQVVLGS